MSIVIFLRHAQSTANEQKLIAGNNCDYYDPDLTKNGISQAQQASLKLLPYINSISFIVSSNTTRTNHTANIVNKELGKEIFYDSKLQEMFHGDFEGKHTSLYYEAIKDIEDDQCPYFGGESKDEFKHRIVKPICEYLQRNENSILVVSHGLAGKALTQSFFGEALRLDNAEFVIFDPTTIPNLEIICHIHQEIELNY